jgi:hypothetical protein
MKQAPVVEIWMRNGPGHGVHGWGRHSLAPVGRQAQEANSLHRGGFRRRSRSCGPGRTVSSLQEERLDTWLVEVTDQIVRDRYHHNQT